MNRKRSSEKLAIDYQKLTERIAQENGIQTNLQLFFNPIADSWSEGMFFRRLRAGKYPYMKIFISIVYFLLPVAFWSVVLYTGKEQPIPGNPIELSPLIFFLLVYLLVGSALIFSGIRDFGKNNQ